MVYMPRNLREDQKREIARTLMYKGASSAVNMIDAECNFTTEERNHMCTEDFLHYMEEREAMIYGMIAMLKVFSDEVSSR